MGKFRIRDPRKRFPIPGEELEALLKDIEYLERWFRQHREHAYARAEVTLDEHQLLAAVSEGQEATVGEVAKVLEQSDSQAGRRLAKLEKKGWIKLGKKAKDQRRRTVEVTEKGKAMFASCKQQLLDKVKRLVENIPEEERKRMESGLQELRDACRAWQPELSDYQTVSGRRLRVPWEEKEPPQRRPVFRKGKGGAKVSGAAQVEITVVPATPNP